MELSLENVQNLITVQNGIEKSMRDKLNYGTETLQNGLRIVYIEDPDSQKSCAYMNVSVGCDSDFSDRMGVAHFLEHMLFMGSEKYPNESEYHEFVENNSGQTNAYTANNHTCYHFSIPSFLFDQALDIFSGFFISPLLRIDAVEREVNAVDSEHRKNQNQDMWRYFGLSKHLYDPSHPGSKFGTGDLSTLLGSATESNKQELRDALLRFYNTYYSSERMTLFIYHSQITSEFRQMVGRTFSEVPRRDSHAIQYPGRILQTLPTGHFRKLIFNSVDSRYRMYMMWDIPVKNFDGENNLGDDLMEHVFATKQNGCLYDVLCQKNYLLSLSVDALITHGSRELVVLAFELTETGYEAYEEVVAITQMYMDAMRQIRSDTITSLWMDLIRVQNLEFANYKKIDGDRMLGSFVHTIQDPTIPLEKLLTHRIYPASRESSIERFDQILSEMTMDRCNIIMCNRMQNPDNSFRTDQFYETEYGIYDIPISRLSGYEKIQFELPRPNPYVPLQIQLHEPHVMDADPVRIRPEGAGRWYWDRHNPFGTIDSIVQLGIDLPMVNKTDQTDGCLKDIYLRLYVMIIQDTFRTEIEMINAAGYDLAVHGKKGKIIIQLSGPNNKFREVLGKVMDILFFYSDKEFRIDSAIFTKSHQKILQTLRNHKNKPPYQRLEEIFCKNLLSDYHTVERTLFLTEELKFEGLERNLQENISRLFNGVVVNCVAGGTILESDYNYLIDRVEEQITRFRGVCRRKVLDRPERVFVEPNLNMSDPNSAMKLLVPLEKLVVGVTENWAHSIAISNLVGRIIHSMYFDILRTRMQVGYIVGARLGPVNNDDIYRELYLIFVAQSHNRNVDFLKTQTELFIRNAYEHITTVPEPIFQNMKDGMIAGLQEKDRNANDRISRLFGAVISSCGDPVFDKREQLVEAVKQIDRKSFVQYYKQKLLDNPIQITIGLDAIKTESDKPDLIGQPDLKNQGFNRI